MIFRLKQMSLLLWHYLNQPLFDRSDQTSFGIQRFMYLYRIQTLERCWQKKCHRQRQFYH